MNDESDMCDLELSEDIYCITFISFLKDTPLRHRELMLKSSITFIMQTSLIYLITVEAIKNEEGGGGIYAGAWTINLMRIFCAFLLHMSIISEIRCSLDLMKYAKNNRVFKSQGIIFPFMIASMKLIGGLTTELISIYIIV